MQKTKTYTIRYYIPRVGADGKGGTISSLLDIIAKDPQKMGVVREAGSMVHQVRMHHVTDKNLYKAYFVRFRDELPLVGQRVSADEHPPILGLDEEVIEKNHFCLFVEKSGIEVIAYQMSMEGSDVTSLARYFTHIAGDEHTVSFDEVVTPDAWVTHNQGIIKYIEYEIARPRSKYYAPNPDDTWTRDGINFMNNVGATRFKAKILTTSKESGLLAAAKAQIQYLLQSSQTKKLRIKLSDVDHPIDLFADRVLDKITVTIKEGRPDSDQLFGEMTAAKKNCAGLAPYLVQADEALD
jgi:hypothetical protein